MVRCLRPGGKVHPSRRNLEHRTNLRVTRLSGHTMSVSSSSNHSPATSSSRPGGHCTRCGRYVNESVIGRQGVCELDEEMCEGDFATRIVSRVHASLVRFLSWCQNSAPPVFTHYVNRPRQRRMFPLGRVCQFQKHGRVAVVPERHRTTWCMVEIIYRGGKYFGKGCNGTKP